MKTRILYLVSIMAGTFLLSPVLAQTETEKRVKQFNLDSGLALQGYDPVAYFTRDKAVKGSSDYTYTYQGSTYRFASAQHKEAFMLHPDRYEPVYGGWCAYAMGATGEKVSINPETFKVADGKLYLFYNKFFTNTLPKWNADEPNLKVKADANWRKFYQPSGS